MRLLGVQLPAFVRNVASSPVGNVAFSPVCNVDFSPVCNVVSSPVCNVARTPSVSCGCAVNTDEGWGELAEKKRLQVLVVHVLEQVVHIL